ncbi:MAG TPA: zinc-ribbon domain-containing protein [Balneolales bacterium]|nr:zinc-ribbon domain-containing protein [Balneolales bacterium]
MAKEWHPTKNGNLTPKDVLPKSGKKVWWRCTNDHDRHASIISRARGKGCPSCPIKTAPAEYNLQVVKLTVVAGRGLWHLPQTKYRGNGSS